MNFLHGTKQETYKRAKEREKRKKERAEKQKTECIATHLNQG